MRTFAIGDIHGCHTALQTLLADLDLQVHDEVIFLGDYVDRGLESKQVIDTVLALGKRCRVIALCGNHERMIQAAMGSRIQLGQWLWSGGKETLRSYGFELETLPDDWAFPAAHVAFLDNLQLFYETDSHIFVHATPDPFVEMDRQSESSLLWRRYDEKHPEQNGHFSGKTIVCGHTPQVSGRVLQWPGLLCIDTFCFGGGWLSALEVGNGKVWQANEQGETRQYQLDGNFSHY